MTEKCGRDPVFYDSSAAHAINNDSLHQHDRIHPERNAISGGIKNSDLALVFTRRQVTKADLKTKRNSPKSTTGRWRCGDRRRFKCLPVSLVETHDRKER